MEADFIDLRTGEDSWLKVIRWILFLLALISLLLAETSWAWKALSLAALSFTLVMIYWSTRRGENFNRIRLYRDGMVTLLSRRRRGSSGRAGGHTLGHELGQLFCRSDDLTGGRASNCWCAAAQIIRMTTATC